MKKFISTLCKTLLFLLFLAFFIFCTLSEKQRLVDQKKAKPYTDLIQVINHKDSGFKSLNLIEKLTVEKEIKNDIKKLYNDGWSYQAIKIGYLNDYKVNNKSHNQLLLSNIHQIGSDRFQKMWAVLPEVKQPLEAQKRLHLILNYAGFTKDLDDKNSHPKQLLNHFSDRLDPANTFWDQIASLVQMSYLDNDFVHYSIFNQKIHQFRYVISLQQEKWIRKHFKKKSNTDADALASYLATLTPDDYDLYQSSRLHNKIGQLTTSTGVLKPIYSDNIPQNNYKILIHFHTEFILDSTGHFVMALDDEVENRNNLINSASFNYANQNDDLHKSLDMDPVNIYDPLLIKNAIIDHNIAFIAPSLLEQKDKTNPVYSRNGKSSKQLTRKAIKNLKNYSNITKNN